MGTIFPSEFIKNSRGTANRGTVFFLHANSYSAALYGAFLEPLYSDYEVWAPDLPGHGQSRWNGRIRDWSDLADHFIELLEQEALPRPMIGMGHSTGGIVTMLIAIKRPHWFSRIILLDPVMLPKHVLWIMRGLRLASLTHFIPMARAAERRRWQFPSKQDALEHYSHKKVFANWDPQFLKGYVDHCLHITSSGKYQLACSPQLELSIYQALPKNAWSLPKRITIPTLFIVGKYSDTINNRGLRRLQRMGGNHVVKAIDGGHLFPFEKPVESMKTIKDFLAE
ncbi:alpha/beta hydrolase [bacterium]|nr:alpha/beta hydrolase [bacterium]